MLNVNMKNPQYNMHPSSGQANKKGNITLGQTFFKASGCKKSYRANAPESSSIPSQSLFTDRHSSANDEFITITCLIIYSILCPSSIKPAGSQQNTYLPNAARTVLIERAILSLSIIAGISPITREYMLLNCPQIINHKVL